MIKKLAFQGLFLFLGVPNTSHKLQMMDHNPNKEHNQINAKLKADLDFVGGIPTKADIMVIFVRAGKLAVTKENILAGWKQTGLHPWNPDKVDFLPSFMWGIDPADLRT